MKEKNLIALLNVLLDELGMLPDTEPRCNAFKLVQKALEALEGERT